MNIQNALKMPTERAARRRILSFPVASRVNPSMYHQALLAEQVQKLKSKEKSASMVVQWTIIDGLKMVS